MKSYRTFLCITLLLVCHSQQSLQALSTELPPTQEQAAAQAAPSPGYEEEQDASEGQGRLPNGSRASAYPSPAPDLNVLPESPLPESQDMAAENDGIPIAIPLPSGKPDEPVYIQAGHQSRQGDEWTLEDDVVIHYRNYVIHTDRAVYNSVTGLVRAEGHLQIQGGMNDERLTASRGTVNVKEQTAHLYNVTGSMGVGNIGRTTVYTTPNPFILTGRELIKSGPESYRIIDGSMTSCRLPHPDWSFGAHSISVSDGQARAANSIFHLLRMPVLYLPYVTHPISITGRQSGFLLPTYGTSSTKGTILGDEYYWVMGRSMDATLGLEYYSKRGWAPNAEFRYRGRDRDFVSARFHALFDRGLEPGNINQGGADTIINARRDFSPYTRAIVNWEYLSSYVYRLAFTDNYNTAVNSQVRSFAFLTHNRNAYSSNLYFDRYQSFESTTTGDEIRLLHLPSADFTAIDQRLGSTPLVWGGIASISLLSRSEPDLKPPASHVIRLDLHPELSMPLHAGGWLFRPRVGLRETAYSHSQQSIASSTVPQVSDSSLNRAAVEAGIEVRPPAVERDFHLVSWHRDLRHVIEPVINYRYVAGVNNFARVLRFDTQDILSDTNELEYSLTQRFYLHNLNPRKCHEDEAPSAPRGLCANKATEWISWRVGQKYFFDPQFGGAVTSDVRNVLETSLSFTGPAFLTGAREISPVISRLNMHVLENFNLEWDLDYDPKPGRIASSNIFADYRKGRFTAGVSHSMLEAPQDSTDAAHPTKFDLLRPMVAWGSPTRRGLSAAATVGYDYNVEAVQYAAAQVAWNWDCCGFNVEYRRFALGSQRNENQYRFNFTLAGIGSAGNLRRSERLF